MNPQPAESAQSNPAVARCIEASKTAYRAAIAGGKDEPSAQHSADQAFRAAMPPLKGVRNVRNFIACVAYASLMGLIDIDDSSRLLRAAGFAYSTRRIRNHEPKPGEPCTDLSHSGAIQSGISAIQEPFPEPAHTA